MNRENIGSALSREERAIIRDAKIRQKRIDNGVLVDIEKDIAEDSGCKYIPKLLSAVNTSNDEEVKKVLLQS